MRVSRIRIYRGDGHDPVVICSQLPDNDNTSVTNMAEYLAAEVMEELGLPIPLGWIEHYPEHKGELGEYSLVSFSSWEREEVRLGGVWRCRVRSSRWLSLGPEQLGGRWEARGSGPTSCAASPSLLSFYFFCYLRSAFLYLLLYLHS